MSRDLQDRDESGEDQSELAFAPGGSRGGAREAEPSRSEFFRAPRRPILPLVGLLGAVATVAAFLWLGREEPPPAAVVPEPTPPVASAPELGAPLPEAVQPAPAASPAAEGSAPAEIAPPFPAEAAPAEASPPAEIPALPPVAAAAPAATPTSPTHAPPAAVGADRPVAAHPAARKAAPAAGGGYSVQLLAARSETQVGSAWDKLRGAHPDLLASLSPNVSATEHAGSGTFYRLRAGPLHDRAAAEALCKQLSARHQPCFVVSPGS